ncbi:MAG: hypothetical protein AABZ49_04305, partial [Thermoproteota archaeon]
DEAEFNRETEVRTKWAIKETARNMALNGAVAGIYGLGYATIVAPWKAFELGLKYASQLTDNEKYTHGMMEALFKKKREKGTAKGEPKKEEWNKAKEYKVMQEVKKIEMEYLQKEMEAALKSVRESPKYLAATEEERKKLIKEKTKEYSGRKDYKKALTDSRKYWIAEGAWTIKDEEEFRGDRGIVFDPEAELSRLQYMLTPQEYNELKSLQDKLDKKEIEVNASKIEN